MQCSLQNSDILNEQSSSKWMDLILDSYFAGVSLSFPIESLCEQIVKDEEHRLGKCRFLFVFLVRIASLSAVSLFARFALIRYFDLNLCHGIDLLFYASAYVLAVIFFYGIERYYPQSWFWNRSPTEEAYDWMHALFHGKVYSKSPIYESWEKIETQERGYGISLASTKKLLLLSWRSQKNVNTQEKMRSFEDCLPVAEFICLGISSTFILFGPILQILDR